MKLTDFAIVFVSFAIVVFTISNLKYEATHKNLCSKVLNSINLDNVLEDSLEKSIVGLDENSSPIVNIEYLADNFFVHLRLAMNYPKTKHNESELREHVPFLLLSQPDGFYLYVYNFSIENEEKVYVQNWTEKYEFQGKSHIERFSLVREKLEKTINESDFIKSKGIKFHVSYPNLEEKDYEYLLEGTCLYACYISESINIDGIDYYYLNFSATRGNQNGY